MNKEIDYLKEHLYEIYKYKKSMKDLTYDMDIEHLLRTCKALDYSQKEIERLNNILDGYEKEMDNLINARDKAIEYIEKETKNMPLNGCKQRLNKLLGILKGEK